MKRILVIGASGFLGSHIAKTLLANGYEVCCLVRSPAKAEFLAKAGCEVLPGDISDLASLQRAFASRDAVYNTVHTLSPQPGAAPGEDFMDVERAGLENIVSASRSNGVGRLIYVTFLGMSAESPSAWVRGRWAAEQFLFGSGLDVTCIRPAQIVGAGGRGFDMMVAGARRSVALTMAAGRQQMRNIALDDLVYYLVGVLEDARTYGQAYDVGCDDILTNDQMMDVIADVLGRKHSAKLHISPGVLGSVAPLIERMAKLPKGAIKGIVDSSGTDAVGDPMPIRAILPRPLLSYQHAVERALSSSH